MRERGFAKIVTFCGAVLSLHTAFKSDLTLIMNLRSAAADFNSSNSASASVGSSGEAVSVVTDISAASDRDCGAGCKIILTICIYDARHTRASAPGGACTKKKN